MSGLLGKKLGMTNVFDDKGNSISVTVIEAGPCPVTAVKTKERDGYEALQLGFGEKPERIETKPMKGHFAKAGVKPAKILCEFDGFDIASYKPGDVINVDKVFAVGDRISVTGTSKGKGFQGVVKRHHFGGGPVTHGQSDRLRAPGSVGSSSYPSRSFKGLRMAGRMGGKRSTMKNLKVVRLIPDTNLILIEGLCAGTHERLRANLEVKEVAKMQLEVLKIDGSKTGEMVELSPAVFEISPNDQAIYQAVTAHLANARHGTHKTKTRADVSGGGKKPWKQKHTGRARSGSIRNPVWVGGGTIFGPKPHAYEKKVNDKVKVLAKKSALSYKVKDSGVMIVEDFALEESKTKRVSEILNSLGLKGKKVLMLLPKNDKKVFLATRNMTKVFVNEAVTASVYEILNNDVVLFQKSALTALQDKLVGEAK